MGRSACACSRRATLCSASARSPVVSSPAQRAAKALGEPGEGDRRAFVGSGCHDNGDRLVAEPAGYEGEGVQRWPVGPMGIVDEAKHRLFIGQLCQQRQRRLPAAACLAGPVQ
jgi:hypothetical protein